MSSGKTLPGVLRRLGPSALVCLLALAVYANSFPGSFITDDVTIVRDNSLVIEFDLRGILTTDYWGEGINSGLYRPLTILSYAVNRRLFGPEVLSFHLVNVLLHMGVSLLFLRFMMALGLARVTAWLAAALFAVHPIHTEVVNEVVGRAELLVAFFLFFGLWVSLKRYRGHQPAALLCYAAALLSKEQAVTFLLLLPMTDLFVSTDLKEAFKGRRALYILLAVATVGWLGLRQWVAAATGVPPDAHYATDNPLAFLGPVPRLLSAGKIQILYLAKLLFPYPLLAVYDGSTFGVVEKARSWWGAGAAAFVVLAALATVRGWKARAGYGLGIPFYLASFAVTANVFVVIAVFMAERLAYLPSAGFCLVVASVLPLSAPARPLVRRAALAIGFGYLVLLGGLTLARNPDFRTPVLLYEATVNHNSANARGWFHLGAEYEKTGRFREADEAYRRSIAADPGFPDVYTAASGLLLRQGRAQEALDYAVKGVRLLEGGVGPALLHAARACLELGRPAETITWLDRTGPLYHSSLFYWVTRGEALDRLGDYAGAREAFRRARQLDPSSGVTRENLEGK